MKGLFDTNILIDYLNGIEAAAAEMARYRERLISVVTWMEVQAGAYNEEEADVIEMFLRDFQLIEISRRIAREAVAIRQAEHASLPDAIIWATARTESALLITRNSRDFPKSDPGVRVPY